MMHNPPHPGEIICEEILKPLDMNITDVARHLGVSYKTLSQLLDRQSGLTPEIALRLEKVFKLSAESWLRQQIAYDLWQLQQRSQEIQVLPLKIALHDEQK